MFVPKGYLEFRTAAFLMADRDDSAGIDSKIECLGKALAAGELEAHGIVVDYEASCDSYPQETGEIRVLRPETWRKPNARDAMTHKDGDGRLFQDDFSLIPIIQQKALDAWDAGQSENSTTRRIDVAYRNDGVAGSSSGVHAIPDGYIAFDAIARTTRSWAGQGKIDPDLMLLLYPPDTDAITQALATGSLRAFGISKRTGDIVALPPSVWRMEVAGAPQSIWAIGGNDILDGPDGDLCQPVITRADLARCFRASEIPADPDELPGDWNAAAPLAHTPSGGGSKIESWMLGLAQGYKTCGKTLKLDDAIKASATHLRATTRQAKAAFATLPYPELRGPPRISAALRTDGASAARYGSGTATPKAPAAR